MACGFTFEYVKTMSNMSNKSNYFDVILAMHLFIRSNMLDNHENKQKDAILLFEVGHTLIQTINRSLLLSKQIIQR